MLNFLENAEAFASNMTENIPPENMLPTPASCYFAVPMRGPEFWRIMDGDITKKERNVTLLWKVFPISTFYFLLNLGLSILGS